MNTLELSHPFLAAHRRVCVPPTPRCCPLPSQPGSRLCEFQSLLAGQQRDCWEGHTCKCFRGSWLHGSSPTRSVKVLCWFLFSANLKSQQPPPCSQEPETPRAPAWGLSLTLLVSRSRCTIYRCPQVCRPSWLICCGRRGADELSRPMVQPCAERLLGAQTQQRAGRSSGGRARPSFLPKPGSARPGRFFVLPSLSLVRAAESCQWAWWAAASSKHVS